MREWYSKWSIEFSISLCLTQIFCHVAVNNRERIDSKKSDIYCGPFLYFFLDILVLVRKSWRWYIIIIIIMGNESIKRAKTIRSAEVTSTSKKHEWEYMFELSCSCIFPIQPRLMLLGFSKYSHGKEKFLAIKISLSFLVGGAFTVLKT